MAKNLYKLYTKKLNETEIKTSKHPTSQEESNAVVDVDCTNTMTDSK